MPGKYVENEDYDPDEAPDRFSNPRYRANLAFVPVKPIGNVDEDAVKEGTWRGRTMFVRFGIAGDADQWELNKVFTGLGLSLEGRDYDDLFPMAKGRTACVTAQPPICSKAAPTCAACRRSSATPRPPPPRSTPTCPSSA